VRPEHVAIVTDGAGSWPMRVEALEMLGAERLVYGQIGGTLFTVRVDATLAPARIGDTVRLRATPELLHWFDAETSRRV
jgi:sn-glycerol 3-phosphate transport system ATP-binding protein